MLVHDPLFALDLLHPVAQVLGRLLRQRDVFEEPVHLLLPLAQERAGALDGGVGIGAGEIAGRVAHLRGEVEDIGLQRAQIRVVAQMPDAFAHRIELAADPEQSLAVGLVASAVGTGHVLHRNREVPVAVFKLHDPVVGRQVERKQHEKHREADLKVFPGFGQLRATETRVDLDPGQLA